MGRYKYTGLAHGTSGSPQKGFENDELEARVRILEDKLSLEKSEREKEQLKRGIHELEKAKVKFTKEDVIFVTRDQTGQLIWLEKGNSGAGLEHLLHGDGRKTKGHENDFVVKHGVNSDNIIDHIKKVVSYGKVEYSVIKTRNGKPGFERMYLYKEKYYMISAIGLNGYIVSAYPVDLRNAQKLIKDYRK